MKYAEKFWSRVNKTETCWLWAAALNSAGYGVFRINCSKKKPQGDLVYAHRFSYEMARGQIPDGLHLDHLCRVRNCVNPDHLEAVTCRENIIRGISPYAVNANKTHCIRGHELSGSNLYMRPDGGGRQCLICKHEGFARWYENQKQKTQPTNAQG